MSNDSETRLGFEPIVSQCDDEEPGDEAWYCPECGSIEVNEITYEDDCGSWECTTCGYVGDPGEDFPFTRLPG